MEQGMTRHSRERPTVRAARTLLLASVLFFAVLGGTAYAQTDSGSDGGTPPVLPSGGTGTGGTGLSNRGATAFGVTGASIVVLVLTGAGLVALGVTFVMASRRHDDHARQA
jgi:hypothetical protein